MSDIRRKATEIIRGHKAMDGAGVHLTRVLGIKTTNSFDPFLILDGFDSHNPEDYIKGFPWHPHRGIETVTYLIDGAMDHGDSLGNKGSILAGGVQWMSAGSGIIHQEMPQASQHMLGCQLWVNLPRKDKMSEPSYGDIVASDVPKVEEPNAVVRVIAGNYKGTKGGFAPKYVQVTYLDVALKPGETWEYNGTANNETLFTYLFSGEMAVNEALDQMEHKGCAILYSASNENKEECETVRIKAGAEGARFALFAAEPLREPIAWGGPVVMNTRQELEQAFDEMDRGTFIKDNAAMV
ncbi:pirin family protein [Porphyromonas levii]|uniref:pirin family protein n=1 Tax=Porphyromonas levii TaxID=28114 RepID=UPI001BAAB06D|nr:pirin family protein [Porphyromonas levii]MBR8766163.1 hypothetical protein [Porphyromonas levii]MBR8803036.1 hypothetical protein [Porphyromonas levii]